MEPLIFLGFATLIIFFTLAKKDFIKSVLYLSFLLPLDNRIYFNWGFERASPIRWAVAGIAVYYLWDLYRRGGLKNISGEIKKSVKTDNNFFLLFIVLLIRSASIFWSKEVFSSVGLVLFFVETVVMYLLLVKASCIGKKSFLKQALVYYLLAAFLASLWSFVQLYFYKFQDRVLPGVWPLIDRPVRIGSFFWDINHFGVYISVIIPLALSSIFSRKIVNLSLKKRVLVLVVLLLAFFMTLSRSAWIGLGFGILVYLILIIKKRLFKQSISLVFTGVLLLSAFFLLTGIFYPELLKQLQNRFLSIHTSYRVWDDSINAHSALARGSWEILGNYPIFGGGYGSFNTRFRETSASLEYFGLDPTFNEKIPAHSIWFEPLASTGFLGAVPFFLFVVSIFILLFKAYRRSKFKEDILVSASLISGLFAISLSGIFYSYNLEFFYYYLFLCGFWGFYNVKKYPISNYLAIILTLLITVSGSLVFYKLGKTSLIDWDESIYAQVSRNIIRDVGDPFGLVWREDLYLDNGSHWFEKPPLYMWLTSFSYIVFGVNEFSARFFSGLSGIAGVIALYFFGKDMFGKKVGLISALVLATTMHWVFQSRNGTLDAMASLWILASMGSFFKALTDSSKWKWVGVFLGLTLMTKSALVLIPIASIFLYVLYTKAVLKNSFQPRLYLTAVFWFFAIGFPWHLIEYTRYGKEFFDSYFIYHILNRSSGIEGHQNDLFWYITVIKVWFRHWFVILIPAMFLVISKITSKKSSRVESGKFAFLVIWILVTFLIFSFSVSKIQWYILPAYPALSLVVGYFLVKLFDYFTKLEILNSKLEILNYKRLTRILFCFYTIALISLSSLLLYFWRDMFLLEDYNKNIKAVGDVLKESRDRKYFLPRGVPVYYYDLPPGPTMFYIKRYTRKVGKYALRDMVTSNDGKSFMAVTKLSTYNDILSGGDVNTHTMIYLQKGDIVLFGKDWKDTREPMLDQNYEVPEEIYDPFFFEKTLF